MRANEHAFSTLNTEIFIPDWDFLRDVALFPLGGPCWESSIYRQCADGQIVSTSGDDRAENVANESRRTMRHGGKHVESTGGLVWNCNGMQMSERLIDGCKVLLYDCFTRACRMFPG